MAEKTLVIMAAGLGSRYGGLKQIDPVDEQGHLLIDYAVYDAALAGFERVVCVIKPEMEAEFREAIGDRIAGFVALRYAYQRLEVMPNGFAVPQGRTKPWGTAQAVLCARDELQGPFAVINADDFYGRAAIEAAYAFLDAPQGPGAHAMVGYRIENTLTENGHVARGVCEVDGDGYLTGIVERTRVEPRPGGAAFTEDGGETYTFLPDGTTVSMNLWGFQPSILAEIEAHFPAFLRGAGAKAPLTAEYFLPSVPNDLIREGRATVRVLATHEKWYGVTYRDDMAAVRAALSAMREAGRYPTHLWRH